MAEFSCKCCGECCQRYWIMLLPVEATAIAKHLKLTLKDFVSEYCSLFLEFFPSSGNTEAMFINSSILPLNIFNSMQELITVVPNHLLVLPSVALKRNEKNCVFYEPKESKCMIHDVKPLPCKLFPFLSLEEELKSKNFPEIYPFCEGLKSCFGVNKNMFKNYYPLVENYFMETKKSGFRKIWKHYPSKGIATYKGVELCKITEKDFFEAIAPFI